ncbi:hypothetical protein Tco_0782178 [Tanacetum coccineum]
MYVSGHDDIFEMVDIDLFTIIGLNMMVVHLGYTGKSEPLSFKLIEVYIEHGVAALDCYLRAPRLRETIEAFTDEPGSIAANRTGKMLFLTWHDSRETTKKPFSTASQVIDDAMRKLSFENTELDGEAGFTDVVGSGVDNFRVKS